ncbi:MAG: anion permease [Austwickia sp.]|nr:anion permease [Austwickia sp.]MBK8435437.1 anion permease [Austwickia sp.]MBK9101014.1 anion permease [Austwickia sp.]
MPPEVIALLVLAVVFLIATVRSINMGALALVAAAIVGVTVYGVKVSTVVGGFPGGLFVILVGVTYLFAIAKNNGTVEWIVHSSVRAVRGRVALVPWVMFAVCALVTAIGAVSPAAVAIVAPVAMGFAARYGIHPVMMGLMVVQGATAGSFSPMGIFGAITNGVVESNKLPGNRLLLFLLTFLGAGLIALASFLAFGGRELMGRVHDDARDVAGRASGTASGTASDMASGSSVRAGTSTATDVHEKLTTERILTLAGLAGLAIGALVFGLDVGFTALTVACLLTLAFPASAKGAVEQISWGTILLVGGIVTYVSLLEDQGTVKWLGDNVAQVGAPLVAALLICFIGAVVSAFASTTGILGALIPLAVPFLLTGQVEAVGMVIALAISSSVVDCSPFSTNGALIVANSVEEDRDMVFRRLMQWGMAIVVVAPIVTWAALVVPRWL